MSAVEYAPQAVARALCAAALALGACRDAQPAEHQGYVEGEFVHLASPLGGRLERLSVERGQTVAAGAPLFALEAVEETAAHAEARARLAAAEATLADLRLGKRAEELEVTRARLAEARALEQQSATRLARDEAQFRAGGIARAVLDDSTATHAADVARVRSIEAEVAVAELPSRDDQVRAQSAQVEAARAALDQAAWRLEQKSVAAIRGGLVDDTLYREGEWVAAGKPVVRLLPPENVKVRFFVPETLVGALAVGRAATVRCDGCAADVPVTITYVASEAEFTPPVIYSNETRAKLVFLVEARPAPGDATKLRPGQPVGVTLR